MNTESTQTPESLRSPLRSPVGCLSTLNDSILALFFELENKFAEEGNRAGEMKREMEEEWDQEQADQFHGRRDAFFQASDEVRNYRLRILANFKKIENGKD
jgi:hypothetical protein